MVQVELDYKPAKSANLTERVRRSTGTNPNAASMHFSWDSDPPHPPRLVLTADSPDFDPTIIDHFKEEGFAIAYLPYNGKPKEYIQNLQRFAEPLELGDKYAIVAYGTAAALCLEACLKPMPKLIALVAYYPTFFHPTTNHFPPSLNVQIHLSALQNFSTKFPSFKYSDSEPGFAEHDLPEFDKVSARLAWSRTLGVLRKAFDINVDLETIWDNHTALEFAEKDADKTMATMVPEPYVNHVPTMTGGIGYKALRRFYAEYFIPRNPPSLKVKVLSRTVGTDRVVDEMLASFYHTQEIPWLLPGVPATGKFVEVVLVGVICIRGGKLYHEHLHWDQATVLVQIGLLDPKLIPQSFQTTDAKKRNEVKRMPVLGAEAAGKVVDEENGESNELIPGW